MSIDPADYVEIVNMMGKYANIIDFAEWHRLDEIFSDDCVLDLSHVGYPSIHGIAALRKEFPVSSGTARKFHIHSIFNIVIENIISDRATVRSRTASVARDHTVDAGQYLDELVRGPHGWRIARRAIIPLRASEEFQRPQG
jgi:hypothetical protein